MKAQIVPNAFGGGWMLQRYAGGAMVEYWSGGFKGWRFGARNAVRFQDRISAASILDWLEAR